MFLNTEDLVDSTEVAEILGLSTSRSVSIYRQRYEDFPEPVVEKASKVCVLWHRPDIETWVASRAAR